MTNGHGDQPDTVLGAGVWAGEARGVHSAIGRGDIPATGDCQRGDTNIVSVGDHPSPQKKFPYDSLMKFQCPGQITLSEKVRQDQER